MTDFYQILDIPPDSSAERIKEQYRFLANAWHPDKFANPAQKARAQEKIKDINEAYQVLSNAAKRRQYDAERAQGQAGSQERDSPQREAEEARAQAARRQKEAAEREQNDREQPAASSQRRSTKNKRKPKEKPKVTNAQRGMVLLMWLLFIGGCYLVNAIRNPNASATEAPAGPLERLDGEYFNEVVDGEILLIDCSIDWESCRESQLRDGAYYDGYQSATVESSSINGQFSIKKVFLVFDTTLIPSNAIITAASLVFFVNGEVTGDSSVVITPFTGELTANREDFPTLDNFALGVGSITTASWYEIGLDVSYGSILPGNYTRLAIIHNYDFTDQMPNTRNLITIATQESGEFSPLLWVNYYVP